jgi:hypothetical protein
MFKKQTKTNANISGTKPIWMTAQWRRSSEQLPQTNPVLATPFNKDRINLNNNNNNIFNNNINIIINKK